MPLINKRRDTRATDARREKINRVLMQIFDVINDGISNSLPDGDPFDYIFPRVRRMGVPMDEIHNWLDKAVKKHDPQMGTYDNMVATIWDDHKKDLEADAISNIQHPVPDEWSGDNPWR